MADPNADPTSNPPANTNPAPANNPPAVDVQAAIKKALADQQAEFSRQLKEATGHDDIKSLTEATLKAQGRLQELADAKTKEAQTYKQRFEQSQINAALLSASTDAVDPGVVRDLLAARAACDEDGNVSIDGKPAIEAVKKLLEDKPFLAKAQGGTGSGAPQQTGAAAKNPWSKEHFNLTEQIRIERENAALAAKLKAEAGK